MSARHNRGDLIEQGCSSQAFCVFWTTKAPLIRPRGLVFLGVVGPSPPLIRQPQEKPSQEQACWPPPGGGFWSGEKHTSKKPGGGPEGGNQRDQGQRGGGASFSAPEENPAGRGAPPGWPAGQNNQIILRVGGGNLVTYCRKSGKQLLPFVGWFAGQK